MQHLAAHLLMDLLKAHEHADQEPLHHLQQLRFGTPPCMHALQDGNTQHATPAESLCRVTAVTIRLGASCRAGEESEAAKLSAVR